MTRKLGVCVGLLWFAILTFACQSFAFSENTHEFTEAEKQFETRHYTEAEKWYLLAATKYQGQGQLSAYIQNQLAECYRYEKKIEDAVTAYRKLQTAFPSSPQASQAQEKIARTYYEAGKYEQAGAEFEKLAAQHETAQARAVAAEKKGPNETEDISEALGYSAYCYFRTGNKFKAAIVEMKYRQSKQNGNKTKLGK